jgi:hypothetical protein
MSRVTEAAGEQRPPLLARVITMIAMLSLLLFVVLWASSWVNSRGAAGDHARGTDAKRGDRYFSFRILAALKTFEFGIVRDSQEYRHTRTDANRADAERLVRAVPQCAAQWSKKPSWLSARFARMNGRELVRCSPDLKGTFDSRKHFDLCSVGEKMAVDLELLDGDVIRLNEKSNRPFKETIMFDSEAWLRVAAEQVGKPVRIDGMGEQRMALQCRDIPEALDLMVRDNGALIEKKVAWRDTTPKSVTAKWRPSQQISVPTALLARRNPWHGVPGCVYLQSAKDAGTIYYVSDKTGSNRSICEHSLVSGASGEAKLVPLAGEKPRSTRLDDPGWQLPPSLGTLVAPLAGLLQPSGELYATYTEDELLPPSGPTQYRYGPNQLIMNGVDQTVGFSVKLGIDVHAQAIAQQVAACYTGNQAICAALEVRRAEDDKKAVGSKLLENAMVRMAAVAIIDVATGRVEALAGDLSPCTRQMYDGPGLDKSCDTRVPGEPRYNPDRLLNPAVFHDAMPASTIKPIMAAAFLSDGAYGQSLLRSERSMSPREGQLGKLQTEIKTSASKAFLERMFCAEKGYRDCQRPWEIQTAATSLGWNAGCSPESGDCGMQDLLFGRPLAARAEDGKVSPLSLPYMYGRLMAEKKVDSAKHARSFGLMAEPKAPFDPAIVRECSRAEWKLRRCRGAEFIDVASEGWGQGNARASAIGVAGIMARLAAAADGKERVFRPHLVGEVRGVRGPLQIAADRWEMTASVAAGLDREKANIILGGMAYSHRAGGTAGSACGQILGSKACQKVDWIAGKTGTPTFTLDGYTLEQSKQLCSDLSGRPRPAACTNLRPYKWYAAVYKSSKESKHWDKAIAVLTERNWETRTEKIHGVGDHGPNPAAEIALQVVSKIRQ